MANAFEGILFKPGSFVDDSALWPDAKYPAVPLLLEFAGCDGTGRGHNRSSQIHVLWRFAPECRVWIEIARTLSQGSEWLPHMLELVTMALDAPLPPDAENAAKTVTRLLSSMDKELAQLSDEEKDIALNLIYEQIAARMAKER